MAAAAAAATVAANCILTDYQHEAVNQQLGELQGGTELEEDSNRWTRKRFWNVDESTKEEGGTTRKKNLRKRERERKGRRRWSNIQSY